MPTLSCDARCMISGSRVSTKTRSRSKMSTLGEAAGRGGKQGEVDEQPVESDEFAVERWCAPGGVLRAEGWLREEGALRVGACSSGCLLESVLAARGRLLERAVAHLGSVTSPCTQSGML